jgi:CelD/BcsL family acetyltransferase involved in cellulose biosynthesis
MTPGWYETRRRTAPDDVRTLVAVVHRENGTLAGLLPLELSRFAGMRRVRFAGADFGDRFLPVADRRDEVDVAAAAVDALVRELGWSVLILHRVDRAAAWWAELPARSSARLAVTAGPVDVLPYEDLSDLTWDEYLARHRNLRKMFGRRMRMLEREREVTIRSSKTLEEVSRDVATLRDLHRLRFPGSTFLAPDSQRFHAEFSRRALEQGWLRLMVLEIDGQPAAAWYGWRVGDRVAKYQSGLDPDWSHYSPGTLLEAMTIRDAIGEGARTYDLLLGDEQYKRRFASRRHEVITVMVTRARHPARAIVRAGLLMRRLRAARPLEGRFQRARAASARPPRSTEDGR